MAFLAAPAVSAPKPAPRNPTELGRVAIVPALVATAGKPEGRSDLAEIVLSEIEERFRRYDIAYVPRSEVMAALAAVGLVPSDPEDRVKAKLQELADHLKVRYIVSSAIADLGSKSETIPVYTPSLGGTGVGTFSSYSVSSKQGKVQFQVFDGSSGRYVEDLQMAKLADLPKREGKASRTVEKSVRNATKGAMELFLKPYPKVHDQDPAKKAR